MAYLGRKGASAALTSADIPDGSVTAAKVTADVATQAELDGLVDSAPGALNTLNELAAALNDDAAFSTTVTNSIALKAPIASPTFTGNFTSVGIDDNADALAMTIFPSENIAIGVATDPNTGAGRKTLQIHSVNDYSYLVLTNNTTGSTVASQGTSILTCGDNFSILNREPGNISLATSGTDRMTIASGGNVGIGIDAPLAPIEITSDATNTSEPYGINNATETHTGLFLTSNGNAVNEKYGMQFGGWVNYSIGGIFGCITSSSNNTVGDLTFDMRELGTHAGLTERMRITSAGNVGIGNVSPSATPLAKIHSYIPAGNAFSTAYNNYQGDGLHLHNQVGSGQNNIGGAITFASAASIQRAAAIVSVQTTSDEDTMGLAFYTHPSTDWAQPIVEAMRIDASGNVGIGVTYASVTPTAELQIEGTGTGAGDNPVLMFNRDWADQTFTDGDIIGKVAFGYASTEGAAIRGEVTATWGGSDHPTKIVVSATPDGQVVRDVMEFQAYSDTQSAIKLFGASTCSLHAEASLAVGGNAGGGSHIYFLDNAIGVVTQAAGSWRSGAVDLGHSSGKWKDVYCSGTVYSSDEREKNTIADSDLGLDFVNALSPKSYIWNNGTRTHYGLIAQDIETVLSNIGKSTQEFAGFIKSDLIEVDGTPTSEVTYGLRITEFISPMLKAIQELSAKVTTLENA